MFRPVGYGQGGGHGYGTGYGYGDGWGDGYGWGTCSPHRGRRVE